MSDDHFIMPIRVEGDLRPPYVVALETAMDMCKEAGWTVETVIIHKMYPEGLGMWRMGSRSGEEGWCGNE